MKFLTLKPSTVFSKILPFGYNWMEQILVEQSLTLLNSLVNIDYTLLDNTNFLLTQILLFGNTTFNARENTKIINLTIDFILSTKRFDEPVLWVVFFFSVFSP